MRDDDPLHNTLNYQMQKLELAVDDMLKQFTQACMVPLLNTMSREIQQMNTEEATMDDANWLERFWRNLVAGFGYLWSHPLFYLVFCVLLSIGIAVSLPMALIIFVPLWIFGVVCGYIHHQRTAKSRETQRNLDYAKIRRLELEFGFREEDEQDREERRRREADPRMTAAEFAEALSRMFTPSGHQPTKTVDTTNPPRGGSGTKGTPLSTPQVPYKGTIPPYRISRNDDGSFAPDEDTPGE